MARPRATAVAPIGPVAVGTMLWRRSGALHLTALVKARLALVHGGAMRILGPAALVERDVHAGGDPTHSLETASDLVPLRPLADVWLRGHAQFPGPPASVGLVRLAIYRGREAVLDKTIHVVGDRRDGRGPEPFERMPLVYERAFGGVGHDDNPVGVGLSGDRQPNLLHPDGPLRSIGFGPISKYWKLRRGCLGGAQRREFERSIVEVPEGFDAGYFQAAPLDQRVEHLRGDEWIVIDGVDPTRLRVQSRLPKVRGVARLSLPQGAARSIPLALDTLAIDADAMVCSVVWRGAVAIEQSVVDGLVVAGSLLRGDQREAEIPWARAAETLVTADAPRVSSPRLDASNTATITDAGDNDFGQTIVDRPEGRSGHDDEPVDAGDATSPMRLPMAIDTEPGGPPVIDDDLPWVLEAAVEPEPVTERTPRLQGSRPRLSSLPPAPIDREAYARALRQAGASEDDIAALLRFLASQEPESDA
jgi:hypothetical protein